uniref:Sugar phosphate transporter domain-containing protein n=1 Tax=Ascaris lumbricoides TaxID=6252 RepID=A0A9J2PGF7_ASCLU
MASVAIAGTLTGCIGCMLDIESISKRSPGCMNLMTCATFVSISLIGLITHSRFFTKMPPNKIPLMRGYLPIVVLFFLVSVSNNLALNFDISVPLFIIFRSGTLLANLLLGRLLLGRIYSWRKIFAVIFVTGTLLANLLLGRLLLGRIYSWRKIFAVIFVTVGVVLFTMASSQEASIRNNEANRPQWASRLPIPPFAIGIGLLTCALFTSAYLGICQENLYRTYGKHPKEAMFFIVSIGLLTCALFTSAYLGICQENLYRTYGKHPNEAMFFIHALSLPGFLFLYGDIWQTCIRFSESPPLHIIGFALPIPSLWAQLASICVLQWMCITNVYTLTSLTNSLNVTMVVTLRKFLSLALSIYVFENPFRWIHASSAALVLIGTLAFTDVNFSAFSLQRLFTRAPIKKRR